MSTSPVSAWPPEASALGAPFTLPWPAHLDEPPPRAPLLEADELIGASQLRLLRGNPRLISAAQLSAHLRDPGLLAPLRLQGLWLPDLNLDADVGNIAALSDEPNLDAVAAGTGVLSRRLIRRVMARTPWTAPDLDALDERGSMLMATLITLETLFVHAVHVLGTFPGATRAGTEAGVSLRRHLNFTVRWPHLPQGTELRLLRAAGLDGQLSAALLNRRGQEWLITEPAGGPARDLVRARLAGAPTRADQLGAWTARLPQAESAQLLGQLGTLDTHIPQQAAQALTLIQRAQGREWSPVPEAAPSQQSAARDLWAAALPPLRPCPQYAERADHGAPGHEALHAWTLLQLSPPVLAGLLSTARRDPLLRRSLALIARAEPHLGDLSAALSPLRQAGQIAQWRAIESGED